MTRLVVLLVGLLAVPSLPLAAAPQNDEVAGATMVSALPFSDTVDTSEATAAPGDLDCSGLEDTHTVWYAISPTTDMVLGLRTQPQFPGEVSTSVATGSPGSLVLVQCSFASAQTLSVAAGTTYHIQLASAGSDPGGVINISMTAVDPISVSLRLHKTADINGSVTTVGGTIQCSRALPPGSEVVVQGTLSQGDASGWLVPFHSSVGCPASPLQWETTVQVLAGTFVQGKATLSATAFACDEFVCAPNDQTIARIRLR
jgi:hypothetical protein